MSQFVAEILGASDQATRLGGESASIDGMILAYLIASESWDRFGKEGTLRPAVGPRGVIELSVARRGTNLFLAFIPRDVSKVRVEVSSRIREGDPDQRWVAETVAGEKLEEMKAIALGKSKLPNDSGLQMLVQEARENRSE